MYSESSDQSGQAGRSSGALFEGFGVDGVPSDAALGLDSGEPWAHGSGESPLTRLQGDFYFEPDNVRRGVAQVTGVHDGFFGDMDMKQGLEPYGDPLGGWGGSLDGLDKLEAFSTLEAPALARGSSSTARQVPEHVDFHFATSVPAQVKFGGLASTMMTLTHTTAAEAANHAYAFLTNEFASKILKVRIEKFAINAEVVCSQVVERPGLSSCALKVRVFQPPELGTLSVEFRRQGGDAYTFGYVFDKALGYMQSVFQGRLLQRDVAGACPALGGAFIAAPLPPVSLELDGDVDAEMWAPDPCAEVQPLVDALASSCGNQAEDLAALSTLAGVSTAAAVTICTAIASVQRVLADLISHAQLDVAYPASKLAVQLAQHGASGMAEPLLLSALQCVAADHTDKLVRLELAEAVKTAAQRCAMGITPMYSPRYNTLRQKVPEVLNKPAANSCAMVQRRLTEALGALEAVEAGV